MSRFSIKLDSIKTIADEELIISRRIGNCSSELNDVRSEIRSKIKGLSGVDYALQELGRQINEYDKKIKYCYYSLKDCAGNYERTEKLLASGLPLGFVNSLGITDVSALLLILDKVKNIDKILFDNSGNYPKITVNYGDYVKRQAEIEGRELTPWEKFWSDGYDGNYIAGKKAVAGSILGFDTGASISGGILNYDTSGKAKADFDLNKGNIGASAKAEAGFSVAKGEAKANFGNIASVDAKGSVGNASASGEIVATLFDKGKLSPELSAKVAAAASVASGAISGKIGNETVGASLNASGEVLGAHADASAGIGKVTYKDDNGNTVSGYGVQAQAGAEAYLAQGEIEGGFDFFGYHVDLAVEGKAGGAGAKAGVTATTGAISGELGAGLGLGLGIKFNVNKSAKTY